MAKLVGNRRGSPARGPAPNAAQLTMRFLEILAADFDANGRDAVEKAREKDPIGYLRAVAALLPKDMTIDKPTDGLSDDELAQVIGAIRERRATLRDAADRHADTRTGGKAGTAGRRATSTVRNGKDERHAAGSGSVAESADGVGGRAGAAGEPQPARGLPTL